MAEEKPKQSTARPSKSNSAFERLRSYTRIAGATGVVWGTTLATYRGHSVPHYALSMGTSFGIASLVFFGSEALIRNARGDERDALGYVAAGTITGLGLTVPFGGRIKAVQSTVALAAISFVGFYGHAFLREYLDELGRRRLAEREATAREVAGTQERLSAAPLPSTKRPIS